MAQGKRGSGKKEMKQVATATISHVRIAPQKLRLVMNLIRGQQIEPALQILQYSPKKGCRIALKLLKSAIANATEGKGADVDRLWIKGGFVNMGRTIKRVMPRAQGRADQIHKKSSHLTIVLGEK